MLKKSINIWQLLAEKVAIFAAFLCLLVKI